MQGTGVILARSNVDESRCIAIAAGDYIAATVGNVATGIHWTAGYWFAADCAFIDQAIAIVIDPIAKVHGYCVTATAGIRYVFIYRAITIVVEAIAQVRWHRATGATSVCHAFVNRAVAVVVDAVA